MRNLKKVIALVAVFAVMISTVAFAQTFTDVKPEDNYYEAIETLNKLGILTGDDNDGDGVYDFRPNDTITRAEVAVIVARIQGNTGTVAQTATVFNDVPSSHWASGYIAMASNQGIVNGYGDGNFGPEDPVKYEEVVKMMMETVGWKPYADANGGYPTGYLAAAQRADLLLGATSGVVGESAPRGLVAQLTYNAIDVPLMDRAVFGANAEYIIYDGTNGYNRRTLMSQYLKVAKLNGIVEQNILSSLTEANSIDTSVEETVNIEILDNYDDEQYYEIGVTETFKVGDTDARDYLGYNVVFYVQQDRTNDDATILSITETSGKNQKTSFTLDQFDGISEATNGSYYLEYMRNATDRTPARLALDETPSIIYNGVAFNETDAFDAMFGEDDSALVYPESSMSGKVTVVDNDNTSGYDVVFVEIAATGVVEEYSERGELSFMNEIGDGEYYNNTNSIMFDEEDYEIIVNVTKDGVAFDPAELEAWDVVTIIARTDGSGEYYDIRVLDKTAIEGTIASEYSSTTSATGKAYQIDGTRYDVAEGYYSNGTLKAGNGGLFYIDEYGKIVAYDKTGSKDGVNDRYAYILNTSALADEWNNNASTLQMLLKDGSWDNYRMASSVTIENATDALFDIVGAVVPTNGDRDLRLRLTDYDNATMTAINEELIGQLVTYEMNANGQLRKITLPYTDDSSSDNGTLTLVNKGTGRYDERNMSLDGDDMDENTVVFYINGENEDDDLTLGMAANKDYSEVGRAADLSDNTEYTYATYDEDDYTGCIKVAVVFNANPGTSASQNIVVIDQVGEAMDEDGFPTTSVEYYDANGELQVAIANPDLRDTQRTYLEEANRGDAFKLNVTDGVINGAMPCITFEKGVIRRDVRDDDSGRDGVPLPEMIAESSNDDEAFTFGAVTNYNKSNRKITVTPMDPETGLLDFDAKKVEFKTNEVENVYVYDPSRNGKNQLYIGGASSIDYEDKFMQDGMKVYDRNDNVITETPAYGMLDYVFVRMYEKDPVDVVVYKSIDYGKYTVK